MHASVKAVWHAFSEPLEGRVRHMYLDVKGLVTTGVGNLIDPVRYAMTLPWKRPDGSLATAQEIAAEWQGLKARPNLAKMHYRYAGQVCKLRLTDNDIDALVESKLAGNVDYLRRTYFPEWDTYPADAQLGILSMAWAVGPGFPSIFKNFTRHVLAGDWLAAAVACTIKSEGNPGVIPRNERNRVCFRNAAAVVARKLNASELYWPKDARSAPTTQQDDKTMAQASNGQTQATDLERFIDALDGVETRLGERVATVERKVDALRTNDKAQDAAIAELAGAAGGKAGGRQGSISGALTGLVVAAVAAVVPVLPKLLDALLVAIR